LFDLTPKKKKEIERKIKLITAANMFESVFSKPNINIVKRKSSQSGLDLYILGKD
jgi:hypothetical protein